MDVFLSCSSDPERPRAMANELSAPPVLSTPAELIFEHAIQDSSTENQQSPRRTDNELRDIYEIHRTANEIRNGGWRRVGLQFPDAMLGDASWVAEALGAELAASNDVKEARKTTTANDEKAEEVRTNGGSSSTDGITTKIYILADTSYSACCVDEIAAEHVAADAVVHYGRSCLSPTSRLPVIYVFTKHQLDHEPALNAFEKEYPEKDATVVLMADVTYHDHVQTLAKELYSRGYTCLLSTEILHDPKGRIPNRKMVSPIDGKPVSDLDLKEYSIFHISTPPTALLLALSSRVKSLYIHPTSPETSQAAAPVQRLLGRRYARLLSLASAGVIGILVNTLSVANYLESIDSIRKQIAAAGKKSYTVVVGKLNPAKLANFAEVDGWVVVGCWESSLVEDDAGFYRPVITPFELEVALAGDEHRVWTGEWWGGIERVIEVATNKNEENRIGGIEVGEDLSDDSEEESAPPEFDLRTGKLISHSRPLKTAMKDKKPLGDRGTEPETASSVPSSNALALRPKAELVSINGIVSPGAEYLKSQRTWQGLGSDFAMEESTAIEEGRSGVARGYTVGEGDRR